MSTSGRSSAKLQANYEPLSPITFLYRAAQTFPERTSIIYGKKRYNWKQTLDRCIKLASALASKGLAKGDVVGFMATNTPELYEAHFGVPMAGLVLNALNCRLDHRTIAYIIDHSEIKLLFSDREFSNVIKDAVKLSKTKPEIIDIDDLEIGQLLGSQDYEAFISDGSTSFEYVRPIDEWDNISVNYTSGTTGEPKGVVYHYRGAYLNALGNILEWNMDSHPVYLWTLPMFHCNGWCFPWTIAAKMGTNVCIRKVTAKGIYNALAENNVDHFCGAPIVLSMVANASNDEKKDFRQSCKIMTAAAPPSARILQTMKELGFNVTHVYGLTEVYGPCVVCTWKEEWNYLSNEEQASLKARQGLQYTVQDGMRVVKVNTMTDVPKNGETLGEVVLRGNITMKEYLKNPKATQEAFSDGWFHTGDLGVLHSDGYLELRDRAKDIIISGGENISSIEIENCLYLHPKVAFCGVVAKPDEKWGETPCAFVELKVGEEISSDDLISHCRNNLSSFKVPKSIVFKEIPKTSTGKIQKSELRKMLSQKS